MDFKSFVLRLGSHAKVSCQQLRTADWRAALQGDLVNPNDIQEAIRHALYPPPPVFPPTLTVVDGAVPSLTRTCPALSASPTFLLGQLTGTRPPTPHPALQYCGLILESPMSLISLCPPLTQLAPGSLPLSLPPNTRLPTS